MQLSREFSQVETKPEWDRSLFLCQTSRHWFLLEPTIANNLGLHFKRTKSRNQIRVWILFLATEQVGPAVHRRFVPSKFAEKSWRTSGIELFLFTLTSSFCWSRERWSHLFLPRDQLPFWCVLSNELELHLRSMLNDQPCLYEGTQEHATVQPIIISRRLRKLRSLKVKRAFASAQGSVHNFVSHSFTHYLLTALKTQV